mgnify:CR=1 FL=1
MLSSKFFIPKLIADIAPGQISIKYGFRGQNFATVSACASSSNAIIDALNYIRLGYADVMVSGGSEAAVIPSGIGGFNALQALSTRNDDPATASRPFDKGREGFVLGEGSGTLILEEYEHAIARGAKIYAEIAGGGLLADAHHITAPHPEGLGARNVMKNCLKDDGLLIMRHPNSEIFYNRFYKYLIEYPKYILHKIFKYFGKKTKFTIVGFQNQHLFYFDVTSIKKIPLCYKFLFSYCV